MLKWIPAGQCAGFHGISPLKGPGSREGYSTCNDQRHSIKLGQLVMFAIEQPLKDRKNL